MKALEYLAAGLPMVTTPLGARGLDILDQEHALIAGREDFHLAMQDLVGNAALRQSIASAGRKHAIDRFSWDAIGARTAKSIDDCLRTFRKPRCRKILVLNDFSAAEPTSGGEVRINRIYRELAYHYDVKVLCLTQMDTLNRVEISAGFIEMQIPKTADHRKVDTTYNWRVSAGDIINYQQVPFNALLLKFSRSPRLQ